MEGTERKLVVLKTSPWSERAKWALDHHGLAYETIAHTPFLGERRLRRIAGASGKERVTVPVLVAAGTIVTESWDIALYADREGKGAKLFPGGREAEIQTWNALADEAMRAGRSLLVARLLASPHALDDTLPPVYPRWVRPALRPITRYGTKWFARKYELRLEDAPAHVAKMRSALDRVRAALAKSAPYLLGTFSYADIVTAILLQGVSPVDDRYIPLEPATREAWTRADLASEFADLVAWRDELYERHRRGAIG